MKIVSCSLLLSAILNTPPTADNVNIEHRDIIVCSPTYLWGGGGSVLEFRNEDQLFYVEVSRYVDLPVRPGQWWDNILKWLIITSFYILPNSPFRNHIAIRRYVIHALKKTSSNKPSTIGQHFNFRVKMICYCNPIFNLSRNSE